MNRHLEKLAEKTAVIIKGNPKYDNEQSQRFYERLADLLKEQGYSVKFDAGKSYTLPEKADVYIGHSRGADRLQYVTGVKIPVGTASKEAVNHPKDNALEGGIKPNRYHYTLNKEMKQEVLSRI